MNEKCSICGRLTSLFNYGAHSCSACGSFFRRTLTAPKYFDDCRNEEKCFMESIRALHSDCKFCRFHKCVDLGMLNIFRFTNLSKLITGLSTLDTKREDAFLNWTVSANFKSEDLLKQSEVAFVKKPSNVQFDCHDWGFMNQITTIEYLKKMDFTKFLSSQDLSSLLKRAHFTHALLTSAWKAYSLKQGEMTFPNGMDIFPKCADSVISANLLNSIRYLLVGRFIELRITREEYLLICAIVFCNPAVSDLSNTGRKLIGSYQNVYNSILFQHCSIAHQRTGHTRFQELLSVFYVVSKTHEEVKKYTFLFQYAQPKEQPSPLYLEIIQFLKCRNSLVFH